MQILDTDNANNIDITKIVDVAVPRILVNPKLIVRSQ
jgi:hypothetical protein